MSIKYKKSEFIKVRCNFLQSLFILTFILINAACIGVDKSKIEDWNFDSIEHPTELYLIQTDDKFGEWGGDTYFLRMYRNKRSTQLQIDYTEYEGNNGPPYPPGPPIKGKINWFAGHPILFEKKHIQVDERYLKLVSSSIQELVKAKIENKEFIMPAGVKNTIMYSDSSMIIQDYPSIKWDEFHELQNLIKK